MFSVIFVFSYFFELLCTISLIMMSTIENCDYGQLYHFSKQIWYSSINLNTSMYQVPLL